MKIKEISIETAEKYARQDCESCGGYGIIQSGRYDTIEEKYCLCVMENMMEKEGESREE